MSGREHNDNLYKYLEYKINQLITNYFYYLHKGIDDYFIYFLFGSLNSDGVIENLDLKTVEK